MRLPQARIEPLTAVVGPRQPLQGLSGRMRRVAYGIPEHRVQHWLVLLAADRVEALEHRVAEAARGRGLALGAAVVSGVVVGAAVVHWWQTRR